MLLAIDTSAGTSIAIVADDGRVIVERSSADTRRHAEVIGPFLAEALEVAERDGSRLSHVVAGIGPGPYTGLRVGIAAARAIAIARRIPLLAGPSHEAVALSLVEGGVAAGRFAVITDARRREVAVTVFAAQLPLPTELEAAHLVARAAFAPTEGVTPFEVQEIPAAALALAALARLAAGAAFLEPQPLYLRAPDVTLSTPKRVS
ncbi:tRNA (adenosine(37)-N6)-threonylcarbamoyltransferase complex dimerization subunit type 1 TsaB [Microcella alkalica]|uniref:tRNA threonylcarbamoyl adenosine modification protein YeaZ n=1 Tax=Microcella alkalica TaxID=355930 RepID=A0A839EC00_9MICO|nr:tRNA (adenosine(37)-N6)-threonylcarbamoyltransferase complex dimerization subunit type 1 TsaB [Microcella alkalica]MBA8848997.1 tRNA threonylcarbamoyl adenosine modification protein YeaZ [Microcella alkalica]